MAVVIETTAGDITVDLFTDERPQTCKNFLKLCKIKYYNFCLFHSIQHNFIAQTGDPTGSGKGGESIYGKIDGEKARYYEGEQLPKIRHYKAGLLSMVNCGDNMLGSQFFITLANDLQSLDGEHCVFGEVTEGEEILLKLNDAICDTDHRPYQDIRITHTVVLEDPFDDPPGLVIPDGSPEPTKENLANGRIAPDEDIDDTAGRSAAEIEELVKQREAQARATILEMVGDLPDADVAPPENVLFVCKLNPVTSDDDLEIIFSRFGKINSCEVIRDKTTGDSLQYAFIEFDEQKSCEDAYFKMANVLIDDRRIHVDFSQSVSKYRWMGKGRGVKIMGSSEDAHVKKEGGPRPMNQHSASKDYSKSRGSERRDYKEDREQDRNRDKERGRDRERDRDRDRDRDRPKDRERDRDRERERERERERDRERDKERERERDRDRERDRGRERNREREYDRDRDRRDQRDSRDSKSHKDRSRDHTSRDAERNGQRYYESERDRKRKNEDDDSERNRKRDPTKDEKDGSEKELRKDVQKEEDSRSERESFKGRNSTSEREASNATERRDKRKEDHPISENEDSRKRDPGDQEGKKGKYSNEHHKQSRAQNTPDSTSSKADGANSRISQGKHSHPDEITKNVSREDKGRSKHNVTSEPSLNSIYVATKTGTDDGNVQSKDEQTKTTVPTSKVLKRDRSISTESAGPRRNSTKSDSISGNEHHKQDKNKDLSEYTQNTAQKSDRILETDDSSRAKKHSKQNSLVEKKSMKDDNVKNDSTEDCSNGDSRKRKATSETKEGKSKRKKKRSGSTSSSDTSDTSSSSSDSSDSSDSTSSDSDQKSKSRRKKKKKSVVSSKSKRKPRVVKIVKRKKKKHSDSDSDSSSDDSSSSDDHRSSRKKNRKRGKRKVEKVVLIKRKRKHSTSDETDSESESSASSSSSDEKSSSRKKRKRDNEKKMKKKNKKQVCKKNKNGSTMRKKGNKQKNSDTSSSETSDSEKNSTKLLVPD